MRFNPVVSHKPGKQLFIADALSRNPTQIQELELVEEVEAHADAILSLLASF